MHWKLLKSTGWTETGKCKSYTRDWSDWGTIYACAEYHSEIPLYNEYTLIKLIA
jgi:hypothetical protein